MLVVKVIQALEKHKVRFAIAGGWAVALHGAVRGTVDLDLVVSLTKENVRQTVNALRSIGIESRLPLTPEEVIDFREEYIQNKKMFAWRFMNASNPAEIVDVLIIEDLKDLEITQIKLGKNKVPIVSINGLIRMKKRSGRPQDLEDIKALEMLKK